MKEKVQYPKAMWSPQDEYKEVRSEAEEAALREQGWIDGHEYWAKKASVTSAPEATAPSIADSAPTVDAPAVTAPVEPVVSVQEKPAPKRGRPRSK